MYKGGHISALMYILQCVFFLFSKNRIFCMPYFLKYAMIASGHLISKQSGLTYFQSENSIRIISNRISTQSKHRNEKKTKGLWKSALSCLKKYALCCSIFQENLFVLKFLMFFYDRKSPHEPVLYLPSPVLRFSRFCLS